jgi:probable HAF family extracellular repeat protein
VPPYNTQAFGIDDRGQIAGEVFLTGSNSQNVNAYVYSNGGFTTLSAPFGSNTYYAASINNSGQVVGHYLIDAHQGFLYDNGVYTSLPPYMPGYPLITGINDRGQIVGSTWVGNVPHGFVFQNGVYTALNDPLGVNGTGAAGVNNQGQIVGYYFDSNFVPHGYVYSDGTYVTIDDPLGVAGTMATGINDRGQVVGYYLDGSGASDFGGLYTDSQNGTQHAFLATPVSSVPAPIAGAGLPGLISAGCGLLGWWRRRQKSA